MPPPHYFQLQIHYTASRPGRRQFTLDAFMADYARWEKFKHFRAPESSTGHDFDCHRRWSSPSNFFIDFERRRAPRRAAAPGGHARQISRCLHDTAFLVSAVASQTLSPYQAAYRPLRHSRKFMPRRPHADAGMQHAEAWTPSACIDCRIGHA